MTLGYASWTSSVTDVERNAFMHFVEDTAPSLEKIFRSRQWLQLALQSEVPTVFSAITAVGCMAWERAQILVTDHALTQLKTNLKEEVALAQYCKATLSLQKDIDSALTHGTDIEPILICSLLFALFETFRGEPALASSHLQHGRRSLESATSRSSLLQNGQVSRTSHAISKELLSTFDILDSDSYRIHSLVPTQDSSNYPVSTNVDGVAVSQFATIEDAKHALDCLISETFRWRDDLLMLTENHLSSFELGPLSIAARHCVKHCLSRSIDIASSSKIFSKKDELVEAHDRWLQKLTALLVDSNHQSLRLLQLQHFYSHFLVLTSRDTTGTPSDRFDSEFKRFFDLAKLYLDYQDCLGAGPAKLTSTQRKSTFSLETGPLSVLFLISLKCCDHELKSQAMNLLRQANRREGLQWSGELSIYADCIAEYEEAQAEKLNGFENCRPLDWWFQRIPEAEFSSNLVMQGVGYHNIRIVGCRYLQEDCKAIELLDLWGAGMPPLHLQEFGRTIISIPTQL